MQIIKPGARESKKKPERRTKGGPTACTLFCAPPRAEIIEGNNAERAKREARSIFPPFRHGFSIARARSTLHANIDLPARAARDIHKRGARRGKKRALLFIPSRICNLHTSSRVRWWTRFFFSSHCWLFLPRPLSPACPKVFLRRWGGYNIWRIDSWPSGRRSSLVCVLCWKWFPKYRIIRRDERAEACYIDNACNISLITFVFVIFLHGAVLYRYMEFYYIIRNERKSFVPCIDKLFFMNNWFFIKWFFIRYHSTMMKHHKIIMNFWFHSHKCIAFEWNLHSLPTTIILT